MNLPLNKRCAEMLTSVSAFFVLISAPAKKTASFMERREICKKIPCI